MKKNIIFITISFLLIFDLAFAQLEFKPLLAKDGYSLAVKKAEEAGFTNPLLIIIGSTTGDYQVGSFKINLKFDDETGKATLWAYIFVSMAKPDSVKAIAVISSPFPLGEKYLAVEVTPDQLKNFPIPGNIPILTDKWIDSGEMMGMLNNDKGFKEFRKSCNSMRLKMIGLGIYEDKPIPDKSKPYWGALFGNDNIENHYFVDALNGKVIDTKTLGNNNYNIEFRGISLFPNPAVERINIAAGFEINNNYTIVLFNNLGTRINSSNYTNYIDNGNVVLGIKDLISGVYSFKLEFKGRIIYGSFIKITN
jgi:hypothetical protein